MKKFKNYLFLLFSLFASQAHALYYTYESTASTATNYPWQEIAPSPVGTTCTTPSGTTFIKGQNNTTTSITLPFTFNYGGTNYTAMSLSSNGFVQFGTTALSGANSNIALNSTASGFKGIFPLWSDLVPPTNISYNSTLTTCVGIFSKTIGTSPNRTFIVEFNAIPQKNVSGAYNTFEFQLKEGSNYIVFRYKSVYNNGTSATVGVVVDNTVTPKDLIEISYNAANLTANKTVLFMPPNTIDHYELEFSPDNQGLTCQAKTINLRSCKNATSPCTLSTDQAAISSTFTLSTSAGTLGGTGNASQSITLTGNTSTTLSNTSAGTSTLSINGTIPLKCYSGSSLLGTCSATFSTSGLGFDWLNNTKTASSEGVLDAGNTSSIVKVSSTQCGTTLVSNTTKNMTMSLGYTDPTSGTKSVTITPTNSSGVATGSAYTVGTAASAIPFLWDNTGATYFKVQYLDSGKVKISGSVSSPSGAGSTNLISKPYTLKVYNSVSDVVCADGTILNATTTQKFCPASEIFTIKVRGYASDGTLLSNFGKESSVNGITVTGSLKSPTGGNAGNIEDLDAGISSPLATGVTVNNNYVCNGSDCYILADLGWDNVGEIYLTPTISGDNYFGGGAMTSKTALPIGRFYAYSLGLNSSSLIPRSALSCSPSSVFNYMGENMNATLNISALNKDGNVVSNYSSTNFNPTNSTFWGVKAVAGANNLNSRMNFSSGSGTWSSGILNASITFSLNRLTSPDGPYNAIIGIAPTDADGVTIDSFDTDTNLDGINDALTIGSNNFYFGRMKIGDSIGSDLLSLPIPIETQYYNGFGFVTNTNDSCTTLSSARFSTTNFTGSLASNEVSFIYPSKMIAGKQTITMNKPSGGDGFYSGNFDLSYDLTTDNKAYLYGKWITSTYSENPKGKIILSIPKAKNKTLLIRQVF